MEKEKREGKTTICVSKGGSKQFLTLAIFCAEVVNEKRGKRGGESLIGRGKKDSTGLIFNYILWMKNEYYNKKKKKKRESGQGSKMRQKKEKGRGGIFQ